MVNYQATMLPTLGGDYDATGPDMNDSGVVVGWSQDWAGGLHHPMCWVNGTVGLLPLGSAAMGWADAIDARGDIVGKALADGSATGWALACWVWVGVDTSMVPSMYGRVARVRRR